MFINVLATGITHDTGSGFVGYLWQDLSTNQTITVNYDPLKKGFIDTILVLATSAVGCKSIDSAFVIYDSPIDKENENCTDNNLRVYLNPTKGEVTLNFDSHVEVNVIRVYSSAGRLILENAFGGKYRKMTLDISKLRKGVYFIQIETFIRRINKKIIIDKFSPSKIIDPCLTFRFLSRILIVQDSKNDSLK